MDAITDELADAIEAAGYEVTEASINRDRIRISVRDAEASGEKLREATHSVIDEEDILGFNVNTESLDDEQVTTVVSFRYRG